MLFADRMEVGCFFTWPDTLCIIGPIGPSGSTGDLYKFKPSNDEITCAETECKYGCKNVLCLPSPDYFFAMREKYKKHLKPKIEKFEVVEGFDGSQPVLGHNFMIDSANRTFFTITFILTLLSILLHN
ncbi:unnamed protein product [Caenorhabditis nigoni]